MKILEIAFAHPDNPELYAFYQIGPGCQVNIQRTTGATLETPKTYRLLINGMELVRNLNGPVFVNGIDPYINACAPDTLNYIHNLQVQRHNSDLPMYATPGSLRRLRCVFETQIADLLTAALDESNPNFSIREALKLLGVV